MADLEKLKEAKKAAQKAVIEANQKFRMADIAYQSGLLAESGLKGHLVSFEKRHGFRGERRTVYFVVDGVSRYGAYPEGVVLKKDGTLGIRRESAPVKDLTDHGVFTPKHTPIGGDDE